jgi:hypothetical protein
MPIFCTRVIISRCHFRVAKGLPIGESAYMRLLKLVSIMERMVWRKCFDLSPWMLVSALEDMGAGLRDRYLREEVEACSLLKLRVLMEEMLGDIV